MALLTPCSPPAGSLSLPEALDRFVDYLRIERGASPHTYRGYRAEIEQLIAYRAKQLDRPPTLDDFTRETIQAWLNGLPYKPSTKQRKRAAVQRWFRFLTGMDLYHRNPAALLTTPPVKPRRPRVLSVKEALDLVARPLKDVSAPSIWQLRDAAVIAVLYVGLRADTLSMLDVSAVLRDMPKPGDVSLVFVTKGDREHEVLLPDRARDLLLQYLDRRNEIPGADTSTALFLSQRRRGLKNPSVPRRLSRKGVYLVVRKWAEQMNIKVWPHLLRHSCGTHLDWRGASLDKIQIVLGHRSINTTRIYVATKLEQQRQTIERHPLHRPPCRSARRGAHRRDGGQRRAEIKTPPPGSM